jgi:hypothetical protein
MGVPGGTGTNAVGSGAGAVGDNAAANTFNERGSVIGNECDVEASVLQDGEFLLLRHQFDVPDRIHDRRLTVALHWAFRSTAHAVDSA